LAGRKPYPVLELKGHAREAAPAAPLTSRTGYGPLADKGFMGGSARLVRKMVRFPIHQRAAGQTQAILRSTAEAAMIEQDMETALESFRAQAAGELSEAESIIATRTEILEKAEARAARQTLLSPVDGIVNAVNVTTIGEVAEPGEPGEPVVTLVPAGRELYVEAYLLNRDVGFVAQGQEVRIKLEAFPSCDMGISME
ncbi:HlyD family efflux transporter periplasmic adaptor subunit, partial [Maricaulis maris]|uniref:HlyD family efflux transporter periplasmic adaptor subunit n=1 Tax=Maricaulis maris TaxID=74318 RepID=UPI001F344620